MNNELIGTCIVAQSGGPTAVINASIYGVIRTALDDPHITKVYGAAHGIRGIIEENLYDMGKEAAYELSLLLNTPSSALGSSRYRLKDIEEDDSDYKKILEIFQKYDVRYFFYNGGNDSMDTCNKISKYMQHVGYECRIMGVPKTIDNDLYGTDHSPGFPSAARYIISTCMELYLDARVYDTPMICIVEIMGRHAGWLTASAAAATYTGFGPDLIYLPETDFDLDSFIADVKEVYDDNNGKVFIAVSEGIHDKTGKLISEYGNNDELVDAFGHKQLGGLAATLVSILKDHFHGTKIRGIEFSLLQRCASHAASQTDIEESYEAGRIAVEYAVHGITDKMVGFRRKTDEDGNYKCEIKLIDLEACANTEKKVPREWINSEGNGLRKPYIDYLLPLIQGDPKIPLQNGLPRFANLKKIKAKPPRNK
ncbi:MAG: 6-phosphofructokinase [Clostridia bacterium]|jgi:6-phosphofructokinase 1|nr:6-phosphofructokinase [Clostridia bacterium]MBR2643788.1 6-phosphofructokinase [Clostridia bacterium]